MKHKYSQNETTIRDIATVLEEMFQMLLVAEVDQWTTPPSERTPAATSEEAGEIHADPGIRQKGAISDPTGDTVANEPRMFLRHTLKRTEKELDQTLRNLRGIKTRMERAQAPWS